MNEMGKEDGSCEFRIKNKDIKKKKSSVLALPLQKGKGR